MFLDFFGLKQEPFGVTPDPAYLYPTKTHSDALGSLCAGIKADRGFLALIADPGMGKTTLLYQLLYELGDSASTVFLFQTQCDSRELLQYILQQLGVDGEGMGLVAMHAKLNEILFREMLVGKRFVLIVDEAQNLTPAVLETVRLLSNFETQHTKLLQIVLAGQPALAEKLASPELSQLRQRIAVISQIQPLKPNETAGYIAHRLKVAGCSRQNLFTPEALEAIARLSNGIPRVINKICYDSLSRAQAQNSTTVTPEIVYGFNTPVTIPNAETETEFPGILAAPEIPAAPIVQEAPPVIEPVAPKTPAIAPAKPKAISDVHAPEPVRLKASSQLTYMAPKRFTRTRLTIAVAFIGVLLLGGLFLLRSYQRFLEPGQESPSSSSTKFGATNTSEVLPENYAAEPKDTDYGQVLTVVARPEQTLREMSLLYIGHFDQQLEQDIRHLNPELRDLDHIVAGQLIRLPLPPRTLVEGKESPEQPTDSGTHAQSTFARVRAFLDGR